MRSLVFRSSLLLLALGSSLAWAEEPCKESADHCLLGMARHYRGTGWVGIIVEPGRDQVFVVRKVWPKSPAAKAGLAKGDRLVAFEGMAYRAEMSAELKKLYKKVKVPGNQVTYRVRRGDQELDVRVRLEAVPDELLARWIGDHMLHDHLGEAQVADKDP